MEETQKTPLPPAKRQRVYSLFNWNSFSYLMTNLTNFISLYCSTEKWMDHHKVEVMDRPYTRPKHRKTVREKMIVWTWSADDFNKPAEQMRPDQWKHLPPRNHEKMLTDYFSEFDLEVDKDWSKWTVRISIPENLDDELHWFNEHRNPPPDQLPAPEKEREDDEDDEDERE